MSVKQTEWVEQLDLAIAERNLLKHPFYQDWQAGTPSRARLQLYAAQYNLHVEAFPIYLEGLAGRSEGALRVLILENLRDERDAAAPHPKLWRDFAAALGVSEETLWAVDPLPGILPLLETYRQISKEGTFGEAVAALYAYEAQVPEIAASKIDGLRRHYGVNTPEGLAYFRVHEEADRTHRATWRGWLEKESDKGGINGEQALKTAHRVLGALWGALDAIQAARC
jgi:pyrroloquinoline-quinone synthase